MCTRGGLLKKTAAVYMFSLYPLKLSEGKKRKILKVREELRLGTCQSTFFLLLAPLPSPTATAPHYASQNRRIYFCILFKNIKILRPIVFISGIFSLLKIWGKKRENSKSSRRASAQSMSVILFFLLLSPLPSPTATATSLYFVQKYLEIFPWVFILPFFLIN